MEKQKKKRDHKSHICWESLVEKEKQITKTPFELGVGRFHMLFGDSRSWNTTHQNPKSKIFIYYIIVTHLLLIWGGSIGQLPPRALISLAVIVEIWDPLAPPPFDSSSSSDPLVILKRTEKKKEKSFTYVEFHDELYEIKSEMSELFSFFSHFLKPFFETIFSVE